MPTLKLQKYYIENIRCDFPKFPSRIGKTKLNGNLTARIAIYLSKTDKNDFALKLEISFRGTKKNTKKSYVIIQATMIGLFKRLDEGKTVKSLGATIGKDILYEKIREKLSSILSYAPITGMQLPTTIKNKS